MSNAQPDPVASAMMDNLQVAVALIQLQMDMFHRMREQCFEKCIPKMSDNDLNVGEQTCLDRYVYKYVRTHEIVDQQMRTAQLPQ
eukprot:EC719241.1.p1 GENE.EC719241.1~~EC719241.1.p1  ORF type:complete len:85 (+),score=11.11 EC719241.1:42-296(+)